MAIIRVRLTFPHESVKRPIIYQIGQEFDVVTNIRRANVTATTGWVVLEISGEQDEIERGFLSTGTPAAPSAPRRRRSRRWWTTHSPVATDPHPL